MLKDDSHCLDRSGQRVPFLVLLGFASAFPSVAHAWLFAVL